MFSGIELCLIFIGIGFLFGAFFHGFRLVGSDQYYEAEDVEYVDDEPTTRELYLCGEIRGGLIGALCKFLYGDVKLYQLDESALQAVLEDVSHPVDLDEQMLRPRIFNKKSAERTRDRNGKFAKEGKNWKKQKKGR